MTTVKLTHTLMLPVLLAATVFTVGAVSQGYAAGERPNAASVANTASSAAMAMSQTEMQYLTDTMRAGMLALETSRIAESKARNTYAKEFAASEVAEQTTLAEVLRSLMPSGTPAPVLTAAQQTMLTNLRNMPAGAAFDMAYIDGQIMGHNELLAIQNTYLRGADMREPTNIAKLARGHIQDHLKVLNAMKAAMR